MLFNTVAALSLAATCIAGKDYHSKMLDFSDLLQHQHLERTKLSEYQVEVSTGSQLVQLLPAERTSATAGTTSEAILISTPLFKRLKSTFFR
jgi:hypothetical protein